MRFSALLIGVGGEGVLTAGALVAMAAHYDGHFVRGMQLHGLSQRGGSIPTEVRFGSERDVSSPGIMEGDADLVIAFEPLEAVRATYSARKEKTSFIIDDHRYMPVYANLLDLPYPPMQEIVRRIKPFAKSVMVFNTTKIAKDEFGLAVVGDTMLLGAAMGAKLLPLSADSMRKAIKELAPRLQKENLAAFERGMELGRRGK